MASRQPFAYGYVKSVISGDCVVLLGGALSPDQEPPEKVVVISGIQAPKFARSKSNNKDEPFAWEAREFLRKMIIGKQVAFNTISSSGTGREYAHIHFNGENLAEAVVKAGLAAVKLPPAGARLSSDKETLVTLQAEATEAGLGMHAKDANPEEHIRTIDFNPDAAKLFAKYRGTPVPAVISQIRDGSTLRCEVMASVGGGNTKGRPCMMVNLSLAGARSPRVPMSLEYMQQLHEKKVAARDGGGRDYDGAAPTEQVWPAFAKEALRFVETRMLHRDVFILLQGVDVSNNVYGTIQYTKGNITNKLLEVGLAEYVPWTAIMTGQQEELLASARAACAKKLRLGATSVAGTEDRKEVEGKVVFVVSGDTISVFDGTEEKKVSLASVRAPRMGRRGQGDARCAMEAREYLRKRLIGKKVRVIPEYTREGQSDRVYATVVQNDSNVGVALVAEGLAEVIPHRQEEPRSLHYAKLMEATLEAKRSSRGIYSSQPAAPSVIDLTQRGPRKTRDEEDKERESGHYVASRARSFLPHLQQSKVCQGVVEYCFSGSRVKVYVPKENILISVVLAGIRTPRGTDEYAAESTEFVRSRVLQHNVRLEIEAMDKGDNFIGSLWVGNVNVGVELLNAGLATLVGYSAERSPYAEQLFKAEADAKEAKLCIYKNWSEEIVVAADDNEEEEKASKGLKSEMQVRITEIADAVTFYFQVADDANVAKVEELMAAFNEAVPEAAPAEIQKGTVMAGLYSDGAWYRVKTEGINSAGQMRVYFVDYGNHDLLEVDNLRELPAEVKAIAGLARSAVLAGLKAPTKNSEHFEGAAITFNEFLGAELKAKAECVDKQGKVHLTLTNPESPDASINQVMLRDGWVRLHEKPEWKLKSMVTELKKDEEIAKDARLNIWEYGDVSDDEDEEDARPNRFDGRPPQR